MMDNNKRFNSDKLLTDIPQRVIVHKILIYHKVILIFQGNPFELFGYFKNDRLRNIWFIFTSLNNICTNVIVDFSKLFNVNLRNKDLRLIKLSELSNRMYTLRSIKIDQSDESLLYENFFSKSKFPKLTSLSLTHTNANLFARNWHLCNFEFFKNITSFELSNYLPGESSFDFSPFLRTFEKDFAKNLKVFILRGILLEEKVSLRIHNLEKLELGECNNIIVIPNEKRLRRITLYSIKGIEEDELLEIHKSSCLAREINLNGSIISKGIIELFQQGNNFKNLEMLKLQGDQNYMFFEKKKWIFCCHLTKLSLFSFSNIYEEIWDDLFQRNEWTKLEVLSLTCCRQKFKMESVKFPRLRVLRVGGFMSRPPSDDFFCFEGKRLEKLQICYGSMGHLTGKDWNRDIFESLKTLIFSNEFNDSFFQNNEFKNLRKLVLVMNMTLKDRSSWKEMKNLEEIVADENCVYIKAWKKE